MPLVGQVKEMSDCETLKIGVKIGVKNYKILHFFIKNSDEIGILESMM